VAKRRIRELERDLAEQQRLAREVMARCRGIEAELAFLRSGEPLVQDVVAMSRSDAIVAVLRDSGLTLSPTEILGRLTASGRTEDLRLVTATLNYLLGRGAVTRPERGRYLVV